MEFIPMEIHSPYFPRMVRLYSRLFNVERIPMEIQFRKHAKYPGHEGYLVVENGAVIGYIYGYTSLAGQYYHDLLARHLLPDQEWVRHAMELVELGVAPEHRGKGIAGRLMDALLEGRREEKALLTVRKENTGAIRFYERKGWVVVKEGFYPHVPEEYFIMGKRLT
ncbi:GNAT family N-acetyltransferase [Rossellomorea marisflavi]|uniref:GNAT family N-acetyltransferase n=2 Tax=Rossellomorea marisflavi TaxID=189381 RepID=UPI00203B60CC|nr:GNAT family N-acetyltransferase [Rossellomorea marisflavi]